LKRVVITNSLQHGSVYMLLFNGTCSYYGNNLKS